MVDGGTNRPVTVRTCRRVLRPIVFGSMMEVMASKLVDDEGDDEGDDDKKRNGD